MLGKHTWQGKAANLVLVYSQHAAENTGAAVMLLALICKSSTFLPSTGVSTQFHLFLLAARHSLSMVCRSVLDMNLTSLK